MSDPGFSVEILHDPRVPPGESEISAVMVITAGDQVDDVALRVWTPAGAVIQFLRQVSPVVVDLTALRGQTGDYPTGSWAPGESRDYHLRVAVAPASPGRETLAARISLMDGGARILAQGLVPVIWTGDDDGDEMEHDTRSTRTSRVSPSPPPPGSPPPGSLPPRSAPERYLTAQLPAQVPVSSDVSLIVRVVTSPSQNVRFTPMTGLTVGPDGAPVTVVVQAPAGLVPETPLEQVISVPPAEDSLPVRFAFRAREAGPQRVTITAWAGGTFLAELSLEVSVAPRGQHIAGPASFAPVGSLTAQPGEVTLQVRSDGRRYTFQLLSESYLFEPVLAEALTAQPSGAVERIVAMLRSMAEGGSGYSGRNARTWMEQAGVGLWNDMVPDLIKDQFWQLRDNIGAFTVAAGDDVIPWELLYPLAPGHDEGFLVEQFPVMRRVYGQQRSRSFLAGGPRYVVPPGSPANARAEVAAISDRLGGPAETIDALDTLLDLIESGSCGPLHFACHNTFKTDAGGSAITMDGGSFVPLLLNKAVTRRSLAARHPLVFINACRTAGAVPEYTRMMGWAQQFLAAGAGAFVGTLWAVRSQSAGVFAEAFYSALTDGASLGEAGQRARAETGQDHGDPTWLAYSVYGDPSAAATAGGQPWT